MQQLVQLEWSRNYDWDLKVKNWWLHLKLIGSEIKNKTALNSPDSVLLKLHENDKYTNKYI